MNERLQAYLDGDLPLEDLPPEDRERARRWDAFVDELRSSTRSTAPAGLEARVMAEAPESPEAPVWRRALGWLVEPRTVRVSPLAGVAAAAALALAIVLPTTLLDRGGEGVATAPGPDGPASTAVAAGDGEGAAGPAERVLVQFRLRAPEASSVAVAGDFTNWEPTHYLSDADGDGVWTGRVPLTPGLHQYMFVVDGSRWVTDPGAERHVDDGFGHRNAVVTITST